MTHESNLTKVNQVLTNIYLPFAETERDIVWPGSPLHNAENDAEHSFSLALICGEMAEGLGLDPDKVATKALVHDLVEVYPGDL